MNATDRGAKHICPDCTMRYYDLKKDVVACPRCGAAPAVSRLPLSRSSRPRTSRPAHRRFP